ncbi:MULTISPECIES: hypothetical protein [unclassified Streptomyces]|uniref:hypothetical protein n=1 Tax=unclassified Streptomyces TaxID=2593676 RepID=UPI00362B85B7
MTRCVTGGHDFPYEDETGAYCHEHGVTLLWHGDPVTRDDLSPCPAPSTAYVPRDRPLSDVADDAP